MTVRTESTSAAVSNPLVRTCCIVLFCLAPLGAAAASSGPVVGWGLIPFAVNGVSGTATSVAAARQHSCAIQAGTGNVVCWGSDAYDQTTPPGEVNGVNAGAIAIASGEGHSIAIAVPEPPGWLGQLAGLGLLSYLHRLRARRR